MINPPHPWLIIKTRMLKDRYSMAVSRLILNYKTICCAFLVRVVTIIINLINSLLVVTGCQSSCYNTSSGPKTELMVEKFERDMSNFSVNIVPAVGPMPIVARTSVCTVMAMSGSSPWASYKIRKIAGCVGAGMPGTFSPPPRLSDTDMHHDTCVTHVPWCMPGSLTSVFLWSQWRGKRSRHSRRMHKPQFCISGKRPM